MTANTEKIKLRIRAAAADNANLLLDSGFLSWFLHKQTNPGQILSAIGRWQYVAIGILIYKPTRLSRKQLRKFLEKSLIENNNEANRLCFLLDATFHPFESEIAYDPETL